MTCRACVRNPCLQGSPVFLIVTHAESDSCALYLVDCSAWPIFRKLLVCSIPRHASEIWSSLYSSQQPQGILQTSSICAGCGPYLPENLPGPLCSSRKAFSAYLSASLLLQQFCRIAFCHVSENLPLHCLFYVTMNICFCFLLLLLHVTSSRFCLYLLNICHFTYTLSHSHTEKKKGRRKKRGWKKNRYSRI